MIERKKRVMLQAAGETAIISIELFSIRRRKLIFIPLESKFTIMFLKKKSFQT